MWPWVSWKVSVRLEGLEVHDFPIQTSIATRCKLVPVTPISLWFMVDNIELLTMVYKPTNTTGHHLARITMDFD